MKKKSVILTVAAAIFIVGLVAAVILINAHTNRKPDAKLREHSIAPFYLPAETRTHFLVDGAALSDNIAGNIDAYLSVDGTVEIIRAATALYRADKDSIMLVYPAAVDRAVLSLDSRYILFNTVSSVFVYDYERDKLIELKGLPENNSGVFSLVISPNGQTYAVSVLTEDKLTLETYICVNSEAEIPNTVFALCKENSCVCAVSDDGETVYYMEAIGAELTKKLYRAKSGREKLIAENVEANFEINRKLTEITFDIDNKTYCSVNAGKPRLLTGASCFSNAGKCYSMMGGKLLDIRLKDTDTLLNSVFYTYYPVSDKNGGNFAAYDLFYVNSSCHGVTLAKGAAQFSVAPDEKNLLVLVDSALYTLSVFNPKEPLMLFSNVYTYSASPDLKTVYFIDSNAVLWHAPRGGQRKFVAENVFKSLMGSDGACFFLSDYDFKAQKGKFCMTEPNGETIACLAENINNFETRPGMTLCYIDAGDGLFTVCAADSKNKAINRMFDGVPARIQGGN